MLSLSETIAGITQLFAPLVPTLRNVLPESLRFQGRIYRRSDIHTPQQLGWYMAALAIAAPQTLTAAQAALQRQAGMNYDGLAAYYCDTQNKPSYSAQEIDPVTITIIITIIGAIIKQAPAILGALFPPTSTPASESNSDAEVSDAKHGGISSEMLLIAALLFMLSK